MIQNYNKINLGRAKDLANQHFGKLTALYRTNNIGNKTAWLCQCECGAYTIVSADSLIRQNTQSCGCLQRERTSQSNSNDLTGKVFGRLKVVERAEKDPQIKDRHIQWLCKCECGTEIKVASNNLTSGHTQSCGCLQRERSSLLHQKDLADKKYGLLTAKTVAYKDSRGNNYWNCECECGNIGQVRANHLIDNSIKSCGCIKTSYGEMIIAHILTDNGRIFTTEKTFETCKNPKTNKLLRFDFYVDNTYVIEFDGIQHFQERTNNFEPLQEIQYRDQIKNKWCIDNNVPIIRIPYTHLSKITMKDLALETSDFIYKGE